MADRMTKVLLTLIAIALWVQLLKPVFVPVSTQAQGTEEEQMIARSKAGQVPVAMEADGGMVYVVTASGMLYKDATADLSKQAGRTANCGEANSLGPNPQIKS